MSSFDCEVAVIGAGSAGMAASAAATKAGARVLLIESVEPGTTCARVGCMPSKLLIAAAEAAHSAAKANVFGIRVASVQVDGRAVLERLRHERDRFVASVLKSYEAIPAEHRLRGHARFIDRHTLMVDGHGPIKARAIVIATGSRPGLPAAFKAVRDRVLSNDNLFELRDLPSSVAVIGAGALGLELGQALHRLGVRVEIFDRGYSIGGLRSDEMNAVAARVFQASMVLRLGVETRAQAESKGLRLHWKRDQNSDGDSGSAFFESVLVAAGRPPNLEQLDLDRAGIELDDRGLPCFDAQTLQCGDSAIFIAGDANQDRALLHEATDEGAIAGRNAARYPQLSARRRRTPMAIVFSDPQVAVVGDVDSEHRLVGRLDWSGQGRAQVIDKALGQLNLYAEAQTGRLCGAEMLGPGAEHFAHLLAWSIQQGQTARSLLDMPFYHPTLEEGLRSALRDLCTQLPMQPVEPTLPMEYGPGV